MTPGKLAAQAGHAFTDVFTLAASVAPDRLDAYRQRPPLPGAAAWCAAADRVREDLVRQPWSGTKIVLAVPDADTLLAIHQLATSQGLPSVLVADHGHLLPPVFDGGLILTALGLGPVRKSEHHALTKRFPLVP